MVDLIVCSAAEADYSEALMRRYPYQVIFRRHADQLVVIAVAHAARKPKYWADR
jgi:hypothetical protein